MQLRPNSPVAASGPLPAAVTEATASPGPGETLAPEVRENLERSFNMPLQAVRVHTDARAHAAVGSLGARAFTYGTDIFVGAKESSRDVALMAHEVAHVIQQQGEPVLQMAGGRGADHFEREAETASTSVRQGQSVAIQHRTNGPTIQGLGLSDILDGLANLAANVPGFTLLTVIIGRNPINLRAVERNFTNLLRGFIGLIPGGELLFQTLDHYGVVARIGAWVEQQAATFGLSYEYFRGRFTAFTDSLGWRDIFSPSDVWRRARDIFTEPINRIQNFISRLISQAIAWLKETFMEPLSGFCREIPGYGLVTMLLGRDPFTNTPVPRTALNVVRGFAEFIPGGTEKVNQLVESHALERAYAWFIQETQARNLTWERVTGTFTAAWNSFRLEDVLHPIDTLRRVVGLFRPLLTDLVSFAGAALMKLLELIFEAVMGSGGARVLAIIKRARATFNTIIRNPVGFLRNLLGAIGQGVRQFMTNILRHLRDGVIAWLTGPVAAAGIQMPERWDLPGIIGFVLQILGLTWARVRQKLVNLLGERVVAGLESAFRLIQDIRRLGLVAALRERVTEFFGQLREAALGSIRNFIQQRLVMAGITQLISMLNPVGAVIQAIIKTYTTIQFFIQKINQILDVVESIVDSIAAIAAGAIGAAANFVERTMARTIPVVLDFLARFIGLGDVGAQVQTTIRNLQASVDRMLDRAVEWIRTQASRIGQAVAGGVRGAINAITQWWRARKEFRAEGGEPHQLSIEGSGTNRRVILASTPAEYAGKIRAMTLPANKEPNRQNALGILTRIGLAMRDAAGTGPAAQAAGDRIDPLMGDLATETARFLPAAAAGASTPPIFGGPSAGAFGTTVAVERLTSAHEAGSGPSIEDGHWPILRQRMDGGSTYYVRGHLLNDNLGGTGAQWHNLAPLTQATNNRSAVSMLHTFENAVKTAVASGDAVNLTVAMTYGRSARGTVATRARNTITPDGNDIAAIIEKERFVPTSVRCVAHRINAQGVRTPLSSSNVSNTIDENLDHYTLRAGTRTPLNINTASAAQLRSLNGVDVAAANQIISVRSAGPFRDRADALARLGGALWHQMVSTSGISVRCS